MLRKWFSYSLSLMSSRWSGSNRRFSQYANYFRLAAIAYYIYICIYIAYFTSTRCLDTGHTIIISPVWIVGAIMLLPQCVYLHFVLIEKQHAQ